MWTMKVQGKFIKEIFPEDKESSQAKDHKAKVFMDNIFP